LAGLVRDVLDRPLALREQVDDLRTSTAGECGRYGRKGVEKSGLGIAVSHMFKLSFEYMNVKRKRV
jgi:hypothetical protein